MAGGVLDGTCVQGRVLFWKELLYKGWCRSRQNFCRRNGVLLNKTFVLSDLAAFGSGAGVVLDRIFLHGLVLLRWNFCTRAGAVVDTAL